LHPIATGVLGAEISNSDHEEAQMRYDRGMRRDYDAGMDRGFSRAGYDEGFSGRHRTASDRGESGGYRTDAFSGGRIRGAHGDPAVGQGRGEFSGGSVRERGPAPRGYGRDYWWLGEREMERRGGRTSYDAGYHRFDEQTRPRFSPVGGMYPAMGGSASMRPPRELRDPRHFSEWTRWF
jgi:hypothetical protein